MQQNNAAHVSGCLSASQETQPLTFMLRISFPQLFFSDIKSPQNVMGQNAKFVHRKISNFAHLKFFNYCLLTEQSVFTILVSLKPRYLKDQH